MRPAPDPPTEVDAALDKLCLELVSLARKLEAREAFRGLMDAAYQVERARYALLEEQSAAADMASLLGTSLDEESLQEHDHPPSLLENYSEVSTTLQEIEHYLADLTTAIKRTVRINERNIYAYSAAKSAVNALAQLRHRLVDTQRG